MLALCGRSFRCEIERYIVEKRQLARRFPVRPLSNALTKHIRQKTSLSGPADALKVLFDSRIIASDRITNGRFPKLNIMTRS